MSEEHKQQQAVEQAYSEGDYRQTIGTALFELFWFGIDIGFVYPESHIAGLWVGVGGLSIAIFRHVPSLRTAMGSIALLLALAFVVQPHVPPMPLPETETHGWLLPADDPTPPNACSSFGSIPDDALLIVVGSEAVWTRAKHRPILAIGGHNMLSFTRDNNGIALDADFFASTGNLVARIESTTTPNEFHLVQPEYSYSKRPDRSSLEVYDKRGNSLFAVRYINPHTLSIKGTFYSREPGSGKVVITDNTMVLNSPSVHNGISYGNCGAAMPASEFAIYSF